MDAETCSQLTRAARNGDTAVIERLLDNGVDVNARNSDGQTALELAILSGSTLLVQYILDKGADVNIKDRRGNTALLVACSKSGLDIVRLLLDFGADIDACDISYGRTPLIRAASVGKIDLVRLLLDRGADIRAKDFMGYTALDCARNWQQEEVSQLIKRALSGRADLTHRPASLTVSQGPSKDAHGIPAIEKPVFADSAPAEREVLERPTSLLHPERQAQDTDYEALLSEGDSRPADREPQTLTQKVMQDIQDDLSEQVIQWRHKLTAYQIQQILIEIGEKELLEKSLLEDWSERRRFLPDDTLSRAVLQGIRNGKSYSEIIRINNISIEKLREVVRALADQGFINREVPTELMSRHENQDSLPEALKACRAAAKRGYKIAKENLKESRKAFDRVSKSVSDCLDSIKSGAVRTPEIVQQLQKQLSEVVGELYQLQQTAEQKLEERRKRLDLFSVSLFGRTMAGKSTLMEVLTNGEGYSIGTGAQRTTRDVRSYFWNGLEVTDVPGVAAFEGEEDEIAAFDAASQADLVLFLITDDAPQPIEAECFARVRRLGKPVIGICNVKMAIDDEDDLLIFLDAPEDHYDYDDLQGTIKQFHEFADLHVPGYQAPFVFTHLRSRFLANRPEYAEHRERLIAASRFHAVESAIVEKVMGPGTFLRVKSFIDWAATPMMLLSNRLLELSEENSRSGRVIREKRRSLSEWLRTFESDSYRSISTFVSGVTDDLRSEIPSFAEDHYEDPEAGKHWKHLMESKAIGDQVKKTQQAILARYDQEVRDVVGELEKELSLLSKFSADAKIGGMDRIFDLKRAWNWGTTLISGGLGIAALLAVSGPIGWVAGALGVIGGIVSFIFDSKEEKARKAREDLTGRLRKNVEQIEGKLRDMLRSWLDQEVLKKSVDNVFRDLDAVTKTLFRLADSQRELAATLNDRQKELALTVVQEALRLLDAEAVMDSITDVARIPGVAIMVLVQPREQIPGEIRSGLEKLLEEQIRIIVDTKNTASVIAQAIGEKCHINQIKIENEINVAHVAIKDIDPITRDRIRLAQQLTGFHVRLK